VLRLDPLDKPFDRPVFVRRKDGYLEVVTSVAKAADLLLNKWPGSQSRRAHVAARQACLSALQGVEDASKARDALEAAAKDAKALDRPPRVITDFYPPKK